MAIMCLKCFQTYEKSRVVHDWKKDYNICPKATCHGKIVEIDELMLPIIQLLNQKGYHTAFCCAGHAYVSTPNTYIKFQDEIDLPMIPHGFNWENENIIRKSYNKKDTYYKKYIDILNTMRELYDWAEGIPDNPRKDELKDMYE